jgi:bacteriorhodopsin
MTGTGAESTAAATSSMQDISSWGGNMFVTIAVVLLFLWLLGFVVFPVGTGLIHLLLVVALISFIWHFAGGRRAA